MMTTDETLDTPEENDDSQRNTEFREGSRRINQERHTETVDKLVVQNKQLQKHLEESERIIEELDKKIIDNSIKISKKIFYICLIALAWFMYAGNKNFVEMKTSLSAHTVIMENYKGELDKSREFNEQLLQRLENIDQNK